MLKDALTLSALIAAVLLVRAAFKNRVPKRLLYALWLVVLLKLCLPGTAYALPLLPAEQTAAAQQTETPAQPAPAAQQPTQAAAQPQTPAQQPASQPQEAAKPAAAMPLVTEPVLVIWFCGSALLGLWLLLTWLVFTVRLCRSRRFLGRRGRIRIYAAGSISSPCLAGLIPAVYLTEDVVQTDAAELKALKTIFEYLPRAYDNGQSDVLAREKMANAATMAGMAFANAFLGVCHSMAHKLGAFHHLPHGVANALMIDEVLRFNAAEVPAKMGTFPQYDHPHTLRRYAEVAEYLGIFGNTDEEKLENLIKAIDGLKERVGIKKTIKEYVPDEQDFLNRLDDMVEQAFDDQCTGANPRYPLMSEIKQMYLNAYYGKTFAEKPLPEPVVGVTETVDPRDFKTVYNKKNSK